MIACPAAGPSTTIEVAIAAVLQLLDLAEHDDVVDARRGGGDDLDHAAGDQPLGDPAEAVGVEVLRQRVAGVSVRQPTSSPTSVGSAGLPSSSTTSTRSPRSRCRARQNCGYRGLPDTTLAGDDDKRAAVRKCSGFTLFGGTCAQTSDHLLIGRLVGLAGLSLLSPSAHASTPVTSLPTTATDDGRSTRRDWRRSTCSRSPGSSTRSSSTPSPRPSTTASPTAPQALILQTEQPRRGRVATTR